MEHVRPACSSSFDHFKRKGKEAAVRQRTDATGSAAYARTDDRQALSTPPDGARSVNLLGVPGAKGWRPPRNSARGGGGPANVAAARVRPAQRGTRAGPPDPRPQARKVIKLGP